ncbi:MAG: hypothetical protein ACRDPH_08310 [Marmoricola sp.]
MSFRPVPHGRTAHRLTWEHLPAHVRAMVEDRLGSPVARAVSQTGGFTPGFASVLTGTDGATVFVKAASRKAQAPVASAYAEEARKLQILGGAIPAPGLRWVHDDDWLVLGFEAVDGTAPERPWQPAELERALDLAEEVAASTIRVPTALGLQPVVTDLPDLLVGWDHVDLLHPDWPHLSEAAVLAHAFADLPAERFAHSDLRDDNVLLCADGRALACDWNWPVLAPAWIDLVVLLVSAYGDGVAVEPQLAGRELTRDVDPGAIDSWLAALTGFMLRARDQPLRPNSPHLQSHANAYAEAAWGWLCERRGWDRPDLRGDLGGRQRS